MNKKPVKMPPVKLRNLDDVEAYLKILTPEQRIEFVKGIDRELERRRAAMN